MLLHLVMMKLGTAVRQINEQYHSQLLTDRSSEEAVHVVSRLDVT
jgi:hypothetical protein